MAMVDVVKWDNPGTTMVWKFPNSELSTMTQLIVNESQFAVLFKNGQRLDVFRAGRHVLTTQNLPVLSALVNLPFGGKSPFSAEVWFLNRAIPLNLKFGTATPIQVEDPLYQVIVPVRAYGQFGLEITDPGLFLQKVVGTSSSMDQAAMVEQFKGILLSKLKSRIAQVIVREKVGVLEIETQLEDISKMLEQAFAPDYAEYGLEMRGFRLMSINVAENDPSVIELKKAKAAAARRRIEGTSYREERGFDAVNSAASNAGAGGAFASVGAGLGIGQAVGQMAANAMPNPYAPPQIASPFGAAPPTMASFHIHLNGQQMGPYPLDVLRQGVATGQFGPQSMVWRPGMAAWAPANTVPELAALFASQAPPFGGGPGSPPPFGG